MADREQALGDGMPAARDDGVRAGCDVMCSRHAPQRAQHGPGHHRRDDGNAEQPARIPAARFRGAASRAHDITTSPGWSATHAAPQPASAINNRNRMIRIHRKPMAPAWRAPPWRRPRIDGMRPAPRRAHRPCRSRIAPRRDRPAPASSIRAAPRLASLRSAAAVTRATTAPRSVPTASVRSMRTSLSAPRLQPIDDGSEPVVDISPAAGGDSFGTSVSNSRLRLAAVGTPEAAKPSSGFSAFASGGERFRRRQGCDIRIALPDRNVEQGCHHDAAKRRRRPPAWHSPARYRSLARGVGVFDLRQASLIADRSGGGADSRGADFMPLTSAASFSDCARAAASSARSEADDFSSATRCAPLPPDRVRRAVATWFWTRRWRSARRPDRSIAARRLTGERLAATPRHQRRRDQAGRASTSAAVTGAVPPRAVRSPRNRFHRCRRGCAGGVDRLLWRGVGLRVAGFAGYFGGFEIDGRRRARWAGRNSAGGAVSSGLSSTITAVPSLAMGRNTAGMWADRSARTALS